MTSRAAISLALVAMFWLVVPVKAQGDVELGLTPSRITVSAPILQGERVRLPSLTVMNRGTESVQLTVSASPIAEQDEAVPTAEWFSMTPEQFVLEPGTQRDVTVHMSVPADAIPGRYATVLQVRGASSMGGGGTSVSAVLGSPLSFNVERSNVSFYDPMLSFFTDRAPWSYVGVAVLLLTGAATFAFRRYQVDIGIRVNRK